MADFYQLRQDADAIADAVETANDAMKLDEKAERLKELTAMQHEEGFWNDVERATKVSQEASEIEKKLSRVGKLRSAAGDLKELVQMAEESGDEESALLAEEELKSLKKEADELSLEALLKGEFDKTNALVTIHAGAGGTEAQDWVQMLYRMYTRYAEREKFKWKELDFLDGEEAGLKSVTFEVSGDYAYGYLKAEKGVHRLVRISPFDSNKRRHTSFASVEVMPVIEYDDEIKINPEDLKVDTYRSGGAGGQHVNKTDSAIRITHLPTGIVVQCQNERSQIQNRETAMKMLTAKLIERRIREREQEEQAIKGNLKKIEWGSQIRSYVFCPYTMVKDHRTGFETANVQGVMDGEIKDFIIDFLKKA